ncbi:MAG: helix-turn-helix transcriptional regulator [Bacteroidota bacterium]
MLFYFLLSVRAKLSDEKNGWNKSCCPLVSVKINSYVTLCPLSNCRSSCTFAESFMDEQLKIFGENIKKLRESKKLSQEELADLGGFDRTYISLVERGKRNLSLKNICRFAKALNVKPYELIKNIK